VRSWTRMRSRLSICSRERPSVRSLWPAAGSRPGLNVRIWRGADGVYAHHLLDPSTGSPVWSGLVGATALGGSAVEAETLSKMALLLGPEGARRVLTEYGGVIVHDSGEVEAVGCVSGLIEGRQADGLLVQ
jgi:hypothetical protein